WHACHRAAQLFGGDVEFVLNSSGHVQSLVSPSDNPRAKYYTNSRPVDDAEGWYQSATEHKGSWWEHWTEWLGQRSGEKRPAPEEPGNAQYPPLQAAPGSYVFQSA